MLASKLKQRKDENKLHCQIRQIILYQPVFLRPTSKQKHIMKRTLAASLGTKENAEAETIRVARIASFILIYSFSAWRKCAQLARTAYPSPLWYCLRASYEKKMSRKRLRILRRESWLIGGSCLTGSDVRKGRQQYEGSTAELVEPEKCGSSCFMISSKILCIPSNFHDDAERFDLKLACRHAHVQLYWYDYSTVVLARH